MPRKGRASQGRYPELFLAILVFLCGHVGAAPAAAQDVTVTSANPPVAEQGTINLDVVIGGSGFKKGAMARFLVSGTEDTGGITVNSTTFKSAGELIANINIATNAPVSKFDVEVTNTSGRRGKGIELFAVAAKGTLSSGGGSDGVPGTGSVSDSLVYKVRSDGGGLYDDRVDCVGVGADGAGGWYGLRTVRNTDMCNSELSYWSPNPSNLPLHRYFTIELGAVVGDLDGNGTAESIEKAPGRFQASNAFAKGATSTPVSIYILKVNADGTTTQDTAWAISYKNQAHVVAGMSAGSVEIYLLPGEADADLCEVVQVVNKGGKVSTRCSPRGSFDLPFDILAAKK